VDRVRKILILLSAVAIPMVSYGMLTPAGSLCFASGGATYRLDQTTSSPDYRVRIDNSAPHPDLHVQLVDRPERADFVLADEFRTSESGACRSPAPVRTVAVDGSGQRVDVVVMLSPDIANPDFRVYVHSARHSHEDAAALLAALWKAAQRRQLADNVPGDQ
jgi:hypothetical protein